MHHLMASSWGSLKTIPPQVFTATVLVWFKVAKPHVPVKTIIKWQHIENWIHVIHQLFISSSMKLCKYCVEAMNTATLTLLSYVNHGISLASFYSPDSFKCNIP
jgi:hypothetical protein